MAEETTLKTVARVCNSVHCKGSTTPQRLIQRVEPNQPVRRVWECTVCKARDVAPKA
jgi:hypothetical protein